MFGNKNAEEETSQYSPEIATLHNEFNRAAELMYQEAVATLTRIGEIDTTKADRLKALGFSAVPEVTELDLKTRTKEISEYMMKLISDYRIQYPLNKFISMESVRAICKKYGLVFGDVNLFKGFVPDKNLTELENFRKKYVFGTAYHLKTREDSGVRIDTIIAPGDLNSDSSGYLMSVDRKTRLHLSGMGSYMYTHFAGRSISGTPQEMGLQIAGPAKDFNMNSKDLVDYQLVNKPIADPVILQPVQGGFLIVTAWGDEASDPLVVNQINN